MQFTDSFQSVNYHIALKATFYLLINTWITGKIEVTKPKWYLLW